MLVGCTIERRLAAAGVLAGQLCLNLGCTEEARAALYRVVEQLPEEAPQHVEARELLDELAEESA